MVTPQQSLTFLSGTYIRQLQKALQFGMMQSADFQAFLLAPYLTAIVSQLSNAPSYSPTRELDLLLSTCEKLKDSKSQTELNSLWHYLYQQSLPLIERLKAVEPELADKYEQKLKVFESLGVEIKSFIRRGCVLATSTVDEVIDKLWTDENARQLSYYSSKKELSGRYSVGIDFNFGEEIFLKRLQRSHETFKSLKSALAATKAGTQTEAELQELVTFVITNFIENAQLSLAQLSQLVANVDDKRHVAKVILNAYRAHYDTLTRQHIRAYNRMLMGFSDLTKALEKLVPKSMVVELIQETEFSLSDPITYRNDDEFHRYTLELSCYLGQVDLSLLEEKDFFSYELMGVLFSGLLSAMSMTQQREQVMTGLLSEVPLLIYSELEKDQDVSKAFKRFHRVFLKVNRRADVGDRQHYRDPDVFFLIHQAAIAQQLMLFGVDGVKQLSAQLAETVVSVERFCENIAILDADFIEPLKAYFIEHKELMLSDATEREAAQKLILSLHTLYEAHRELKFKSQLVEIKENLIKELGGKKPSEYTHAIFAQLLTLVLGESHGGAEHLDIDAIFKRMPPDKFTQLVSASLRMEHSEYKQVFEAFLTLDLTGGDVDAFLHDNTQGDTLGRELALHNKRIQDKLRQRGIEPQAALKYPKHRDIVVYPGDSEGAKFDNALVVLWTYCESFRTPLEEKITALEALGDEISGSDKKVLSQCLSIRKQLNEIKRKLTASGGDVVVTLSKPDGLAHLNKIDRNLKALEFRSERDTNLFNASFLEFLGHVREGYARVKAFDGMEHKKLAKTSPKQPQAFRIVQWDKQNPMTSFLGDYVGCCLGSTSSQFPALIQRRMDDAMLFHVAIDMKTKKPAALIWLYLAERPDGSIALVANFFEVNAKYAVDEMTRKALLNGLCAFTHEYCDDNNIEHFYMNVLTYGWNIRDLNPYPVIEVELKDKLGGPFLPGYNADEFSPEEEDQLPKLTGRHYYLASLQKHDQRFHEFVQEILKKEAIANSVTVTEIIQKAVTAFLSEPTAIKAPSTKDIVTYLIQRYGLELSPFFEQPLAKDEAFHALVEAISTVLVAAPEAAQQTNHSAAKTLSMQGMFSAEENPGAGASKPHKGVDEDNSFDQSIT